jgi:hypothetical protein
VGRGCGSTSGEDGRDRLRGAAGVGCCNRDTRVSEGDGCLCWSPPLTSRGLHGRVVWPTLVQLLLPLGRQLLLRGLHQPQHPPRGLQLRAHGLHVKAVVAALLLLLFIIIILLVPPLLLSSSGPLDCRPGLTCPPAPPPPPQEASPLARSPCLESASVSWRGALALRTGGIVHHADNALPVKRTDLVSAWYGTQFLSQGTSDNNMVRAASKGRLQTTC